MIATTIAADGDRVRSTFGPLRPMRLGDRDGRMRVSLLASTALLLGGDRVELQVEVAPGTRLELTDVAGTVAYHGRGRPAAWRMVVAVGSGAEFRYAAEPFVVSDGAEVERALELRVAGDGRASISETLVLGRSGERGGRLRSRTRLSVDDEVVWLEDQVLDPAGLRSRPGLLGAHRLITSTLSVGPPLLPELPDATTFTLVDGLGTVARRLG